MISNLGFQNPKKRDNMEYLGVAGRANYLHGAESVLRN
jgi:hypothetical protein